MRDRETKQMNIRVIKTDRAPEPGDIIVETIHNGGMTLIE